MRNLDFGMPFLLGKHVRLELAAQNERELLNTPSQNRSTMILNNIISIKTENFEFTASEESCTPK